MFLLIKLSLLGIAHEGMRSQDEFESKKDLKIEKQSKTRLATEMQKQGIIEMSPKGFRLTSLGKWYMESCL